MQGVIQLGQAYVNLCEIGDVSHLDWNREYECRSTMGKNVMKYIESQRNEFERSYEVCKEHINQQRMKYRELNYFTTHQLLFLRKELAALKHKAATNTLNLQVYSLLEKVLPGIHPSALQDVLFETGIVSEIDRDHFSDDGSHQRSLPGDHEEVHDHRGADEQVQIAEKYETLLSNVEKLSYPESERLALAALVLGLEKTVAELVVWCVQNNTNDDLIDKLCDEAKRNPRFRDIVNEITGTESSQSSQDSDDVHDHER